MRQGKERDEPMSSEEQEISLIVQRDDLSALELRQRWEERPEEFSDRETQSGLEVVEDEFGRVRGRPGVARDLLGELDRGELEVGGRTDGEIDDGDGICNRCTKERRQRVLLGRGRGEGTDWGSFGLR
jgi:hypothetical protein